MDDMSWFGVMYYIGLFTIAYIVAGAAIKLFGWITYKDYSDGYDDGYGTGFENGTEHGIDLAWDLSYKEGTIDGMRNGYKDGYSQANIDMGYDIQKQGTKHMKIKRVNMVDEDTIGIDLEEE